MAARVLPMAEVNRWFIFIGLHKGLLEDSTEHLHTDQKMTKEGVSPAGHDAPVPWSARSWICAPFWLTVLVPPPLCSFSPDYKYTLYTPPATSTPATAASHSAPSALGNRDGCIRRSPYSPPFFFSFFQFCGGWQTSVFKHLSGCEVSTEQVHFLLNYCTYCTRCSKQIVPRIMRRGGVQSCATSFTFNRTSDMRAAIVISWDRYSDFNWAGTRIVS